MKSRFQILFDNAVAGALAAIEIYNKPNFAYREASFSQLMVNAWELLLKAKILKDNKNNVRSIHIYEGKRIKRNRTNNPLTLDIFAAFGKIRNLDKNVRNNLEMLVAIRDATSHYYFSSKALPYLVFTLGSASLMNFQKYCSDWFGEGLEQYNLYILPLGFGYGFQTFSRIDSSEEPEEIANILRSISRRQPRKGRILSSGFQFICEVDIRAVAVKGFSKKIARAPTDSTTTNYVERQVNKLDRYPYSFRQILAEARSKNSKITQNKLAKFIRERSIKGNTAYHEYTYRSKKHEAEGKPSSDIYNFAFLQLVINDPSFKTLP